MPFILPQIDPLPEYTLPEVAAFLPGRGGGAMKPATVLKLVKRGRLKGVHRAGQWLVRGSEILRYLGVTTAEAGQPAG